MTNLGAIITDTVRKKLIAIASDPNKSGLAILGAAVAFAQTTGTPEAQRLARAADEAITREMEIMKAEEKAADDGAH